MSVWYPKRGQGLPLISRCMGPLTPFSFVWVFVTGLRPGPPAWIPYVSALFNVSSIPCQVAWGSALAGSPCQGFCSWKYSLNRSCLDFKCTVFSAIAQHRCLLLTQNLGGFLVSFWASAKWKVRAWGNPLLDLYLWKLYSPCFASQFGSWVAVQTFLQNAMHLQYTFKLWRSKHTPLHFQESCKPKCKALSQL